jgi:predicted transcriptional regulator
MSSKERSEGDDTASSDDRDETHPVERGIEELEAGETADPEDVLEQLE